MNTNQNEQNDHWPPEAVPQQPPRAWPMAMAPIVQPSAEPPAVVWSMPANPPTQHIVIDVRTDAPRRQASAMELPRTWFRMGFRMGGMFGVAVVVFFGTIAGAVWVVDKVNRPAREKTPADDRPTAIKHTNAALKSHGLGNISVDAVTVYLPEDQIVGVGGFARNEYREITSVDLGFRVTKWKSEEHWELFWIKAGGEFLYRHPRRGAELR